MSHKKFYYIDVGYKRFFMRGFIMKNMFLNCTVILIPVLVLLFRSASLDIHIKKFTDDRTEDIKHTI